MKWVNKLERFFAKFAIRNLMTYIVMLNAVAFVLIYLDSTGFVYSKLILMPALVFKGEVWRLISFIFIPPSTDLLWGLITLYFYYSIGTTLEHEWGTVRFNMYYILGMLGTIAVSMIFGVFGTSIYVNLSLFLAFARLYPNHEMLIFFMIPVKIKYLAMVDWFFFALVILFGPVSSKLAAIIALINYFAFFGFDIFSTLKLNRQVHQRRQTFRSQMPREVTIHRCTVCGKTEKDDPKLEFRYCSLCEGDYEYCMEHLRNHEHIVKKSNVIEFKNRQE